MAYTYISGACGGIGKAFTESCAQKGYDLFLTGRSSARLTALKNEITEKYGVNVVIFECDLTSESSRKKMFDYIAENNLLFDRIINVAGVDTQKPFVNYTQDKLLFQIRVNVESTSSVTLALLPFKAESREINTVSSI